MPIDGLIAFAESDIGAKVSVKKVQKHPDPRQRDQIQRSKILRLPACAACEALLEKKDEILK